MGISGLLPLLKEETVAVKLSQYKGRLLKLKENPIFVVVVGAYCYTDLGLTLVVDISCWLHKGSYGCAMELAQGQKTDS